MQLCVTELFLIMALNIIKTADVIEAMENFLERIRPPEDIRDKLDLDYRIENQSIFIFEIRPKWDKPQEKIESPVAKATYVKSKQQWKVYWMRGNLTWSPYEPPVFSSLNDFLKEVETDPKYCFFG